MAADNFTDMMAAFAKTIAKSLQAPREPSPVRPGKFLGFPSKPGDPSIDEWLEQVEVYAGQADLGEPSADAAVAAAAPSAAHALDGTAEPHSTASAGAIE